MNIKEAKEQVRDAVEAYLAKGPEGLPVIGVSKQRPLFLVGAPGIGKTAIVEQVAHELGIGFVSYSMTHHTRQSALGLPFIVRREYQGQEFDVSEYTMSEIIASVYDCMESTGSQEGILFLDEINCVSETLYPSMLQFLQFKTFGRHRVPDGWAIVCAGNPPEYNKSVHDFDIVTLDRLRRVDIEPDFSAWRSYALDTGVHPAILTFLDAKTNCFYSVETRPSDKRFVTARGWSDLSDTMTLLESQGKAVGSAIVSQFVQDASIAAKFASYYELFSKYRSDYQVDAILRGEAPREVRQRAADAPFDERLALLELMLDALSLSLGEVVEREGALAKARDALRARKKEMLDGGSAHDALEAETESLRMSLGVAKGLSGEAKLRERARTLRVLERVAAALPAGDLRGSAGFAAVEKEFAAECADFETAVKTASLALDNAFDFIEKVFYDGQEMMSFVTELTARRATSRFINRFGCERYYQFNDGISIFEKRSALFDRIDNLGFEVAGRAAHRNRANALDAPLAEEAVRAERENPADEGALPSSPAAKDVACGTSSDGRVIAEYYDGARFEYGYASLCRMTLPAGLEGKTVLDVGCRRGKGVFKLSERVGDAGRVIGIDWVPEYIDEAKQRMERAWRDSHLKGNNMEFHLAYPERLADAGVEDASVDMVFVNSCFNLFYDCGRACREIFRVLRPGGMLVVEGVVADGPRDPQVIARARSMGNSIQASLCKADFEELFRTCGFAPGTYANAATVTPDMGAETYHPVECAESAEDVRFIEFVYTVRKPR